VALLPQTTEKCLPTTECATDGSTVRLGGAADLTLEILMRQALDVPGAATALLEAFAAQSRALRLVQEAEARGAASLPADLRQKLARVVARTPSWLASGAGEGVRA
jgi:hypothetical protein